jgi:hypothetical protein
MAWNLRSLWAEQAAITYTDPAQAILNDFFTLFSIASMWVVRPERLFGLRPHPFGVALRAINFACGEVVELGLSMSGVRTKTPCGRNRPVILKSQNNGAPGEIRTPGLLVRSQALYPTELRARKGREYYHTNERAPFQCSVARTGLP